MAYKFTHMLANVLDHCVSLYAPHECVGCGVEGVLWCADCRATNAPPRSCCYKCRAPRRLGKTCAECRRNSWLVSVNSAALYAGSAKQLVWRLKFDRAKAAGDEMGCQLARAYGHLLPADVLVVPVPTATRRVRARGYDQSLLIARTFAVHAGATYAPLLRRLGSQEQKGANLSTRQEQLREAFEVKSSYQVAGRRIMLIDDVITTGSTLECAADVLKRHGAATVAALAFAKVEK